MTKKSNSSRWETAWSSNARSPSRRPPGGIVLPDTAKDKPTRGTIISVGDGRLNKEGKRVALQVKAGDRVLFTSYAGEQFKIGVKELLLMREDDILAVID